MTYSIAARDPDTGEVGVAVESHFLAVGSLCPWAQAGVGAVATQASVDPAYGPCGLEQMGKGTDSATALADLVAADPLSDHRQVAFVDAAGTVAAHTGSLTIADSGHVVGDGFSCQANMMRRPGVPEAMADAFVSASGPLVLRLLAALDAAEAAGGDIRGRQSAAVVVVSGDRMAPMLGQIADVRVDDHPDPLTELRRLVELRRAVAAMPTEDAAVALETHGLGNPEGWFWRGVVLARGGEIEPARAALERAYALDDGWRELVRRLPPTGQLPDDPDLVSRLTD